MATVVAIPSGTWIQLLGTEWEVYQESGEVVFLGDEDVTVRIRRTEKRPSIWGPCPLLQNCEEEWAEVYDRARHGFRNP